MGEADQLIRLKWPDDGTVSEFFSARVFLDCLFSSVSSTPPPALNSFHPGSLQKLKGMEGGKNDVIHE
jgi:hypothetical protein